jgi:hypothetical protein
MDLGGWNAEFDPNLLSAWSDNVDSSPKNDPDDSKDDKNDGDDMKDTTDTNDGGWDGNDNQWSHLGVPGFGEDDEVALSHKSTSCDNDGMEMRTNHHGTGDSHDECLSIRSPFRSDDGRQGPSNDSNEAGAATMSESTCASSGKVGERTANSSSDSKSQAQALTSSHHASSYLHPMAIQSSANCPAPAYGSALPSSGHGPSFTQDNGPAIISAGLQSLYGMDLERSCAPPMLPSHQGNIAPGPATMGNGTNQHLSSLAANFLLAQSGSYPTATSLPLESEHLLEHSQLTSCTSLAPNNTASVESNHHTHHHAVSVATTHQGESTAPASSKKRSSHNRSRQEAPSKSLPPFYLFDAPIELRANFMQNQRKLGLPIEHDPNSYHYGETVNGFHPQQLLNSANLRELTTGTSGALASGTTSSTNPVDGISSYSEHHHRIPPQLIDARHGNIRKSRDGQVKNEREQKRAQKITELIEQLRLQMEDGGWQVEARSKFHTLSS